MLMISVYIRSMLYYILFIYTGRRRVETFEFVLTRRLPVAATLFCPEFTLLVF